MMKTPSRVRGAVNSYGGLVCLTAILVLTSCGSSPDVVDAEPLDEEATWRNSGITEYSMTYTSTCGENAWITFEPVTVSVTKDSPKVVSGSEPFEVATVDRLFKMINNAREDDAKSVEVSYGDFGQPMSVAIVYTDAIDDQFCVEVSDFTVAKETDGDGNERSESAMNLDFARVGCEFGPFFPVEVLDSLPPLILDSTVPEVADAIAPFLESEEGAFWPQDGWRVLEVIPEELVQLVHPSNAEFPQIAFMAAEWTGDGWKWGGSSIPNNCELMLDPSMIDGNIVEWILDPAADAPTPESTSISILATEQACASGQEMGERFNDPQVAFTDDAVFLLLTARPPDGDSQECPGNPPRAVTIELNQPLGARALLDERSTDLGDLDGILHQLLEGETR